MGAVPEEASHVEKDKTLGWNFTPNPELPNVLILGDSISIGYTLQVRELLKGKANVYRPLKPNGKRPLNCTGTNTGVAKVEAWISDVDWSVIHFNWGLHDLKHVKVAGKHNKSNKPTDPTLTSIEDYRKNLEKIVAKLKTTGANLVFATTTPVVAGTLNPLRQPDAPERYNAVALKVMKSNEVRVNDLNAFCKPHLKEWQLPKNVHFKSVGSKALAEKVASVITEELVSQTGQLEGDVSEQKLTGKKKKPIYLETDGKRKLNVIYKKIDNRELQLDLYYPSDKSKVEAPVVIYTHGGGWAAGSRFGVSKLSFI